MYMLWWLESFICVSLFDFTGIAMFYSYFMKSAQVLYPHYQVMEFELDFTME